MELDTETSEEIIINVTPRNRANLRRLKTTSIQSFQRWEKENELLYAMIEDESSWLSGLFPDEFITPELFFYALEDGATLCLLANYIQDMAEQYSQRTGKPVPGKRFSFHRSKKGKRESKLFQARDNVGKFLSWCRLHGIPEAILFESNDVVLVEECRTGGREIVICLMEIARRCSRYEIQQLPQLINLEREIDEEELNDSLQSPGVVPLKTNSSLERHEDRSPIGSDSGVESVFDEGGESNNPQLKEFTESVDHYTQDSEANNIKEKHKQTTKDQKAPPSLLESSYPKTELDEKVCKIAKDYDIKVVHRLKEGKYIILGKTMFVRMLNDHLLVRIGGGWDTLEHYVMTHSPKPNHTGDSNSSLITQPSESRSRKGSGVWSKLVDKVKKRESQPNIAVSPVVISKGPRPDSTPASSRLRDRFKKKSVSLEEKDGKDISDAIQKIQSSVTAKTFIQLKSRFERGRKHSRETLSDKKPAKKMDDINQDFNDGIKERDEQDGGEHVLNGANDVLGYGETTTTLVDFEESTFASGFTANNDPLAEDPPHNLTADDFLFGGLQSSEQSNLQSSESSSDAGSRMLVLSPDIPLTPDIASPQDTVLETDQSVAMHYSTHEEEGHKEEGHEEESHEEEGCCGVSKEEDVEEEFPEESAEPELLALDKDATDELQLLSQHHNLTEEMEGQPGQPQTVDISMDNVQAEQGSVDNLDDSRAPETVEGGVEYGSDMEAEAQEEPSVSDLSREDAESVEHTDEQHPQQLEFQAKLPEDYEAPVMQAVPQPADQEELESSETSIENVQNVYAGNEELAELVESQPPAADETQMQDESIDTVEDTCRTDEFEQVEDQVDQQPVAQEEPEGQDEEMDDVVNIDKTNEHFTDLTESQPTVLGEPQAQDVSTGSIEDICTVTGQFTEQEEHERIGQEEPTTQDEELDVVKSPDFTEVVESQPPPEDEPQVQDVPLDNAEDMCETYVQLAEQVHHQPAVQEEPSQDEGINDMESLYKANQQLIELVESQPPAADEPQAQDVPLDNVEHMCEADVQLLEHVEPEPVAQEEPQPSVKHFQHVDQSAIENGITETMAPNEEETLETTPLSPDEQPKESSEVDKEPSDVALQDILADSTPAESTAHPPSIPKQDKTKTKTSKTSSSTKHTVPQNGARPPSAKTTKAKQPATSSPAKTAAKTSKPTAAKSQLASTANKDSPAKPQGTTRPPSSTSAKTRGATKKPGAEAKTAATNKSATSGKSTTTTSKTATTSTKPANSSSRPASSSSSKPSASKPAWSSSKPASSKFLPLSASTKPRTTTSRPTTSNRPGTTKDVKTPKPPSAANATTKPTLSKTRPSSSKTEPRKPTDKTDGKVTSSLGKANGKTTVLGSSRTTVKQTTTSTQGPKTTTKTNVTSRSTKTTTQQSKLSGTTGAKPKSSGAASRPKSPTKQPPKKTTTTKAEKTKKPVDVAEPQTKSDNSAPQDVITESVTTTITERTYTEDGDVTTVREVTETVSTNGDEDFTATVVIDE